MSYTELVERLREIDELTLLEILEINSDDIVDAFLDRIVDYENRIRRVISEQD